MTKARVLVDLINNQEHILIPWKNTTIGRAQDNDIQTDPKIGTVSGHHATIYNENGSVYIWDNNSKNGTCIYGKDEEEKEWISKRTLVPLDCTICFSNNYKMRLEERDSKAEESAEEKARTEKTKIIKN